MCVTFDVYTVHKRGRAQNQLQVLFKYCLMERCGQCEIHLFGDSKDPTCPKKIAWIACDSVVAGTTLYVLGYQLHFVRLAKSIAHVETSLEKEMIREHRFFLELTCRPSVLIKDVKLLNQRLLFCKD